MERNRKHIFGDQQLDVEFLDERVKTILEIISQFMNAMRDLRWTYRRPVGNIRNLLYISVQKMGFGHNKTDCLRLVGLTCEVIYVLFHSFQNLCPFACFQRNAVGTIEPRGNEAD